MTLIAPRTSSSIPAIAGGRPLRPRNKFLVFGTPTIGEAEIAGVVDCLRRKWIGTGPKVRELELKFARYKGSPHAVAVNSGTAALHLSLLALGIGAGDEVITTPMTFCSTVNSIIHAGATPVLTDCDASTFNITAQGIERCITPRTRAILVVHMCGRCCDMGPIMELARRRGLLVIEDCAHAVESKYHGTSAGLIGDAGCFSFYATKNMTTTEGGMVLTKDKAVAGKIKSLAAHGMSEDAWSRFSDAGYRHYEVVQAGFKYNMPDINAAIGIAQLAKIEPCAKRRREVWQEYDENLAGLPCVTPPPEEPNTVHAHHLYTPLLRLEELSVSRDHVLEALKAENIGAGVHFIPVHLHKFYRERFGWKRGDFLNAEEIGDRTLSIPLAGEMDEESVDSVWQAMRRILNYFKR